MDAAGQVLKDVNIPAGCCSFKAALGLALLWPFQKLSLRALSFGDSSYFGFAPDPPLLLLPNENPLDRGREWFGVVGPSMLIM